MWGTVENLASSSSQTRDVPAGGCIYMLAREVCPGEVFIAFGGSQGHGDRMASCGGLATRLPVICTAAASQGPIANRPQDAILDAIPPHKSHRRARVRHTLGFQFLPKRLDRTICLSAIILSVGAHICVFSRRNSLLALRAKRASKTERWQRQLPVRSGA
jgi:hypothetical protein